MSLFEVDLQEKLEDIRSVSEKKAMKEIQAILSSIDSADKRISDKLSQPNSMDVVGADPEMFMPSALFSIEDIKTLCIQYRLRFLDASHFKLPIPYEAIAKIQRIESKENISLEGFKIVAPAGLFNLEYKDKDPMLFAPLSDGRYALIHKWGGEMSAFRKYMVFPLRSFQHILFSLVGLAFAISFLFIPDSVIMGPYDQSSLSLRVVLFFYLIIAMGGLTLLYGFSRVKNFSNVLWNSRYDD